MPRISESRHLALLCRILFLSFFRTIDKSISAMSRLFRFLLMRVNSSIHQTAPEQVRILSPFTEMEKIRICLFQHPEEKPNANNVAILFVRESNPVACLESPNSFRANSNTADQGPRTTSQIKSFVFRNIGIHKIIDSFCFRGFAERLTCVFSVTP